MIKINYSTNKKENKRYGIWAWVGAIYGPIIFWVLFFNLPKVDWKYAFESNKTRVARHHQKAKDYQEYLIGEILVQQQYFM